MPVKPESSMWVLLGLSATIEVLNDKQDSLTLKMNDELLKELINEDVLHFDENALAEKLLFIDNFAVEYDDNFTVLSVILQKNKIEWRDKSPPTWTFPLATMIIYTSIGVLLFYVGYIL